MVDILWQLGVDMHYLKWHGHKIESDGGGLWKG